MSKKNKCTLIELLASKRGFTLIELMVSIAILGFISVLFITFMGTSIRLSNDTVRQTEDSLEAVSKLEERSAAGIGIDRFSLFFEGTGEVIVKGKNYEESKGNVTYHVFVPEK